MKKLVINADDFGYRPEINKGIIYAHKKGIVTSASLFVSREGTDNAVILARKNPGLGLGIHIDLDEFFNIDHARGMVTETGKNYTDKKALKSEIKKQIDKYLTFKLRLDHIDSHHHSHLHPKAIEATCEAAKEYNIPYIRIFKGFYIDPAEFSKYSKLVGEHGFKSAGHFIEGWYWGNVDEEFEVAELMTHPGYGELWRETELAHCCKPQLKEHLKKKDIRLVRFSDL